MKTQKGGLVRRYNQGGFVAPTKANAVSRLQRIDQMAGGAPAPVAAPAPVVAKPMAPAAAPAPRVPLGVTAPAKAEVNVQRASALQQGMLARMKEAEAMGNGVKARELRQTLEATGYSFNRGGKVPGRGNTDTVPALLTPGEVVVNKQAVKNIGAKKLLDANRHALKRRS
jgi:hypothetical protein